MHIHNTYLEFYHKNRSVLSNNIFVRKYNKLLLCLLISLFSTALQAQNILARKISFKVEDTPVKEALIQLSEITNIDISFSGDIFKHNPPITINQRTSIKNILDLCIQDQAIIYTIKKGSIILLAKPKKKYTVSGYIEDKITGDRLVGTYIIDKQSGQGTTSNEYGFFSITLNNGIHELIVSYIGYQEKLKKIPLHKNQSLTIKLKPDNQLNEVLVEALKLDSYASIYFPKKPDEELHLPIYSAGSSLGGETDLLQITYLKPGVQTGVGGFGGLHVRGGHEDQNLILMDGVTVYNPSHALGLISIFNSSAIKQTQFYKSGFSAKYGGKLSSVLDVSTKEGNLNFYEGELRIGTFASRFSIEGPIIPHKAGFFFSMRRTHWNPLIRNISKLVKGPREGLSNYEFYDINTKLHWEIKNQNKIFYSFYLGADDFDSENTEQSFAINNNDIAMQINEFDRSNIKWGNAIQSLRWNHLFNEQVFSNLTFVYSRYNYINYYGSEYTQTNTLDHTDYTTISAYSYLQNRIQEIGAKIDLEYTPNNNNEIIFGASYNRKIFSPGIVISDNIDFINDTPRNQLQDSLQANSLYSNETILYVQNEFHMNHFSITAGLYNSIYINKFKPYISIEPRIDATYWKNTSHQFRLTTTKMTQNIHLLSNEGISLPNDLWVPSTNKVPPQKAWQNTLGWHWHINKKYTLTFETYYKYLKDVIAFKERVENPQIANIINLDWEDEVSRGNGHSYGIETIFQKNIGNIKGWVSYTLSRSIRRYPELNDGLAFPYSFDRKHLVQILYKHKINTKLSFSANWIYGTGRPITLIAARIFSFSQNNDTNVLSKINEYRLPDYHRLNIGFDMVIPQEWGKHQISLGLYNSYNQNNILFEFYKKDINGQISNNLEKIRFLPIFPTISYSISLRKEKKKKENNTLK